MHYIIKGDEPWIQCTCKADTPNANLLNIQRTQWQTEPDLAAAPARILDIPKAAVAAMIKTPVAGPRAAAAAAAIIKTPVAGPREEAAAAAIIKTPAPVAMGLTPMEMSGSGTNPGAITAVTRVLKASR
jgi:hypothetical protein